MPFQISDKKSDVGTSRRRSDELASFWSLSVAALGALLQTDLEGLTTADANRRLHRYGPNRLRAARKTDWLTLLLAQFKTPLILILLGASVVSFFLN